MPMHIGEDDQRWRSTQKVAADLRAAFVRLGIPASELIHICGRTFADSRPDEVYLGPVAVQYAEKLLAALGPALGPPPLKAVPADARVPSAPPCAPPSGLTPAAPTGAP
jgi:hypothetical protein